MPKKRAVIELTLDDLKDLGVIRKIKSKIKRTKRRRKAITAAAIASGYVDLGAPKSSSAHMFNNNSFANTSNLTTENLRLQDAIMTQKPKIEELQHSLSMEQEKNKMLNDTANSNMIYVLNKMYTDQPKNRFDLRDDNIDVPAQESSDDFRNSSLDILDRPLFTLPSMSSPFSKYANMAGLPTEMKPKSKRADLNAFVDEDHTTLLETPAPTTKRGGGSYIEGRQGLRDQIASKLGGHDKIPQHILDTTRKSTLQNYLGTLHARDLENAKSDYISRGGSDHTVISKKQNNLDFILSKTNELG